MRRWNIRPSSSPAFHFTFTFYFIPRRHFFLPTFLLPLKIKKNGIGPFVSDGGRFIFIPYDSFDWTWLVVTGPAIYFRYYESTSRPVVPRVSCILYMYRSCLPACLFAIHFGKIRTILLGIVAASGQFVASYRSKLSRAIYLGMFLFYLWTENLRLFSFFFFLNNFVNDLKEWNLKIIFFFKCIIRKLEDSCCYFVEKVRRQLIMSNVFIKNKKMQLLNCY